MPATSSSRRWLLVAGIAAYWLALFVLTHLPVDPTPSPRGWLPLDKLAHAAAFLGLTVLLCAALAACRPLTWPVLLAILGVLATYAALDELTQGLIRHRVPDLRDWLADMLGAGAGLVVYVCSRQWLARRAAARVSYD